MRKVIVPVYDTLLTGLTVGKREKSGETAVMFTVDGNDVIEWYKDADIQSV